MRIFSFSLPHKKLLEIGQYEIKNGAIIFPHETDKKRKQFMHILENSMKKLTNKLTNKPATYIHRNSGIPLLGHSAFGIVDRNTTTIEVKPITGCNISCSFCSVADNKRIHDFVIEMEYLIQEVEKLIVFKQCDVDIFINAHGEPLLYADLIPLIKQLSGTKRVKNIAMITNGTLLTEEKVKTLVDNGLTQLNISLNSLDKEKGKKLMGKNYNAETVTEVIERSIELLPITLAPVWIPGVNDEDIEAMVAFVSERQDKPFPLQIHIQNFLEYKFGNSPAKEKPWSKFYEDLKNLEQKYHIPLVIPNTEIKPTTSLPKPFQKGDIIEANIVCPGRLPKEMIAVAQGRIISIPNSTKQSGVVKLKITRSKHNIFSGIII